jgi:hypothetical protein
MFQHGIEHHQGFPHAGDGATFSAYERIERLDHVCEIVLKSGLRGRLHGTKKGYWHRCQ